MIKIISQFGLVVIIAVGCDRHLEKTQNRKEPKTMAIEVLEGKGAIIRTLAGSDGEKTSPCFDLDLSNARVDDSDAALISQIKPVKIFRVTFENKLATKIVEMAWTMNNLEVFDCHGRLITDDVMANVSQLENLRDLDLGGSGITDRLLSLLKKNKKLRH